MKIKTVLAVSGRILMIVGLSMIFPLIAAFYYGEKDLVPVFISSIVLAFSTGALLYFSYRRLILEIRHREGFAIVTLGWVFATLFGAVPFWFSGSMGIIDAVFETMSGFTTTGASILTDIEIMPKSLLFWRSFTHWLGGMGIVVLFVAILSSLGAGGLQMFKAESPGPVAEKIKPKISSSAKILWLTYLTLTAAEVILLRISGMNLFDSMCHSFGTLATGGFSTKNLSIGHYDSLTVQWIITVFMILSGVNFALYFNFLKNRNFNSFWKNPEFRLYIRIIFAATVAVFLVIYGAGGRSVKGAFTAAAFQVASIVTTTGYATEDFGLWPFLARGIIFLLMFVGGCAGSTGGSVKVGRILILAKSSLLEIQKSFQPKLVKPLKIGGKIISNTVVANVQQFFIIYMFVVLAGTVVMSGFGLDITSAVTSVAVTLGNIGPGLGAVGPACNYSFVPGAGKLLLVFFMLLGRLELYTVLVMFLPAFWKK